MNRILFSIIIALVGVLQAVGFSGLSGETEVSIVSGEAGTTAESKKKYEYFYLEAVRQDIAGNYAAAYDLYRHCLEINPDASEAHFGIARYEAALSHDSIAQMHYETALASDPDNEEFAEMIAQFYLQHNKIDEATEVYEKLLKKSSDRSDILSMLIRIYEYKKNYPMLITSLKKMEVLEGQSEDLTLSMIQAYSSMGDEKGAYKVLSQLVKTHPNDLNYKVMMGNWLLANGRKKESLKLYQQVLQEEPDNAQAQMSLMDYHRTTGNDAEADNLLYKMLVNTKTEAKTRITLLTQAIRENEQNGADSAKILGLFKRMMAMPQVAPEVADMQVAYMLMKNMPQDTIRTALNALLAIDPENTQARLHLIDIMWKDTIDTKVIAECEKAVNYSPEEPSLRYYLGLARYINKQDEAALEAFRGAAHYIKPDTPKDMSAKIFMLMGDVLHSMGKNDEAYEAYDSCLNYNPDEISCLNNYAYFLSEENRDLKRAEQMSYKVITAEPKNGTYLDTYAWILYMEERFEEARIYIDQTIKTDTTNDIYYEHAGYIYAKLGLDKEAAELWQKSIDLGSGSAAILKEEIKKLKK